MTTPSSTSRSSTPSPLTTLLPNLSPSQIAALPYPPDLYPGARDVQTPYGTMRVYEWGNQGGRKIMMVHGDATCVPLWKTVAEELVGRGCRVIVFDLWGRGYTTSPHARHTSRLLALQLLFAASSSALNWCSETFSIIGFSLGGAIAMDFVASFPHLVRSVALIAPAGMLRSLPRDYKVLRDAAAEGKGEEELKPLVKEALGVKEGDGEGEVGWERLVRWQFEEHEGHARSFASTLLHGPVVGQGGIWREACEVLKGKRRAADGVGGGGPGGERLVVVCAADDAVVRPEFVREDLEGFMGSGEEGSFVFETLPGGHGFLADGGVCKGVVVVLGREWGI